ncbi:SARP family transcriptional regulator [Streptomyces fumanus]|uniref:SARP family transcriptional regulator n=1 Tax=Streptomyces fumanus TaxID=67302 RepID=A0A919AJZ0_9ACTN|nr:SARP family transcriptional regulator [Streptomyces fumanus]
MSSTAPAGPAPRDRTAVRFSVLGPVRVWRGDDELPVRPKQQRLVLAALLARGGRPVPLAEFIELLWQDRPPASAANSVHRYIGALRRLLEPDLPARSAGRWLTRQAGGYRLRVDADSLDLLRFRDLADRAREAGRAGEPAAAVDLYVTALGLWQDRCAAGLEPVGRSHPTFVMLEHEYVSVVCEAAETAVRCGRAPAVLTPLRQAVERHPLDEALVSHLLLALADDGKQAEAVSLYQDVRHRLAEELGVDPGRELSAAYEHLLRGRAATAAGAGGHADGTGRDDRPAQRPAAAPLTPSQLPADLACFTGRREAVRQAVALAGERGGALRVLAIDGIPGVGKTALAVHVAHRAVPDFPDGQLYVDLRGFTPNGDPADPHEVLAGFLGAFDVPRQRMPDTLDARAALYRSVLAGRRVLVVLDNAWSAEQIAPLLPGTPECMVIVTSRARLTGLAASHGARLTTLEALSADEAAAAFVERVKGLRTDLDDTSVRRIVDRCGRLPLAVAIVAARAASYPEHPLPRIAAELARAGRSLEGFSDDHLDNDVRAVFSWSYRTLSEPAARLFRLLPLHPGDDASVSALASLAGTTLPDTAAAVGELVRARLLTVLRRDRYRFHDLILAYASELGGSGGAARAAALSRLHDHYRQTVSAANRLLRSRVYEPEPPPPLDGVQVESLSDEAAAMAWFGAERPVLNTLVQEMAARGDARAAWETAVSMQLFQQRLGLWQEWAAGMGGALVAARRAGDTEGIARTCRGLAGALLFRGDTDAALPLLHEAERAFAGLGMTLELVHTLRNIGSVYIARGSSGRALAHLDRALRLLRVHRHPYLEATTLVWAGEAHLDLGNTNRALELAEESLGISRRLRLVDAEGPALGVVSKVHQRRGDLGAAIAARLRAIELARRQGHVSGAAEDLLLLGELHLEAGAPEAARRAWHEVLELTDDPDAPVAVTARERLARTPR